MIIKRICDYLISNHLVLSEEDIVHVVDQLDFCLRDNGKGKAVVALLSLFLPCAVVLFPFFLCILCSIIYLFFLIL